MSLIVKDMKAMVKVRSDIPHFLKTHGLSNRICEVGVRFGYNFQQLLSMNPTLALAVDHWVDTGNPSEQDTNLEQGKLNKIYDDVFLRYLNEPNVKIYRGSSERAAKMFPLQSFDYVYIDADHTEEGAYKDICLWWPRVRQGGILAGHDYIENTARNGVEFGVIQAVERFMKSQKISEDNFHWTREGYCSWMLWKQEGE